MGDSNKTRLLNYYRSSLPGLIDGLSNSHFQVLSKNLVVDSGNQNIDIKFLLPSGTYKTSSMLYVDAMWQFVAVANNFINKTIQDGNFTSQSYENLTNSLDFLFTNGYGSLMKATWETEDSFVEYFQKEKLNEFRRALIIILSFELVVTLIFFVIISRMVVRIERLNNRVIALFVYISERDISEMRGKCTQFLVDYLPDIYDNMRGTHMESDGIIFFFFYLKILFFH